MRTLIVVFVLAGAAFALDVSVDTILAPGGTVDSGQTIIPRMVVSNLGNEPADSVNAWFTIDDGTPGGYRDSVAHFDILAHTTETLAFHVWVPRGRDSMAATAWIRCPADTYPQNDTFQQRFLVRIKDVAVVQITIPAPDTVVDSGVVFYPQGRVWNYGNISLNFDVHFSIGPSYHSTRNLTLIAGGATLATAPDPYTATPGIWGCRVGAVVVGDLHPENNIMLDTFTVRGRIFESLWVRVEMPDTVDTTEFTPCGRAGNCGIDPATFWLFFNIYDSAGTPRLFAESSQVMLNPSDSTDIELTPCRFEPGVYLAVVMAYINCERPVADSHYFWVVPGSGVEEAANGEERMANGGASVLRRLPPGAVVFDAMGRRVFDPKPGIYFVRAEPSAASRKPSAITVRKVILQR